MPRNPDTDMSREDFVNAMREMGTFVDVSVDDLLEINRKAAKYARIRKTEAIRIDKLMTRNVTTVTPDTTLAEAAHLLVTRRISGLPVVDRQQRLVGIVTEADFLRAMGVPSPHPTHSLWQSLEAMFAHPAIIGEATGSVADIMVENVITVQAGQTLHDVVELMKHNRIKRVIVCDEENHVQGMITRSDLVRVFFDRLRGPYKDSE